MKTKKPKIKYEAKEEAVHTGNNKHKVTVYLRITYDRRNTKLKSYVFDTVEEKEIDKLADTAVGGREIAMIQQALAIETDNFMQPLSSFKGFAQKFKFYLKPIDEVYKEYGIALVSGPLLAGLPAMLPEEREIIDELGDLLPFENYLREKGEYYQKVIKRPQVFINLLFSFLQSKEIKSEYKVLTEMLENINYYLEGYYCLQDFIQSEFLENKDEAAIINWLEGNLKVSFEKYLDNQKKSGKRFSDRSVGEITIGLWHSPLFREAYKKSEKLKKI